MNRLTWKMVDAYESARMFRVHHVNDTWAIRSFAHWSQEYRMYQAICECIRRGYKRTEEDE